MYVINTSEYFNEENIIVLPKEQIFWWWEDCIVTQCNRRMFKQWTENNHRYKRDKDRRCANCSGYIQKVSEIVSKRRCVKLQSDYSIYGIY